MHIFATASCVATAGSACSHSAVPKRQLFSTKTRHTHTHLLLQRATKRFAEGCSFVRVEPVRFGWFVPSGIGKPLPPNKENQTKHQTNNHKQAAVCREKSSSQLPRGGGTLPTPSFLPSRKVSSSLLQAFGRLPFGQIL